MDTRLLEPGWPGELAPDEFAYVQGQLLADKQLSFIWGFRPSRKTRPEWMIRKVAMFGDPDSRTHNHRLIRRQEA